MLDTGAQPNIIKKECINSDVYINKKDIIQLTGITENVVNTLGSIIAHISSTPVTFHVVPDEFPIITQGILGSTFFTEHNACINYGNQLITWRNCSFHFKEKESIIVPPRTNSGVTIRISNPEIKTGYIPRMKIDREGVYAGESVVTCINDKAYIRIINTLNDPIEFFIPTIKILEIAEISTKPPNYNNNHNKETINYNNEKLEHSTQLAAETAHSNAESSITTQTASKQIKNNSKNKSKQSRIKNNSQNKFYSHLTPIGEQMQAVDFDQHPYGQEHCLPSGASRCVVDPDRHPKITPPILESFSEIERISQLTNVSTHDTPSTNIATAKSGPLKSTIDGSPNSSADDNDKLALSQITLQGDDLRKAGAPSLSNYSLPHSTSVTTTYKTRNQLNIINENKCNSTRTIVEDKQIFIRTSKKGDDIKNENIYIMKNNNNNFFRYNACKYNEILRNNNNDINDINNNFSDILTLNGTYDDEQANGTMVNEHYDNLHDKKIQITKHDLDPGENDNTDRLD